ncbi:hypothetical protein POSPLADRAFT_1039224 [Postia placenta MAD-698-R-SB12]|uniref:Uncharacterized protein n=1 Tax=Postia placenta MAD-698-R-SB12 TaxID=670580 RepID=A0A1X6N5N4_9APHY|nr:hypothetical protein POSPLADRAFT_1039224 [Postia placenta MAD-698-R-SB12]OSX63917.1 hypothetical protein POSPLADRAFT_1039224 [Postia placenta MAD-698-R-SB12]
MRVMPDLCRDPLHHTSLPISMVRSAIRRFVACRRPSRRLLPIRPPRRGHMRSMAAILTMGLRVLLPNARIGQALAPVGYATAHLTMRRRPPVGNRLSIRHNTAIPYSILATLSCVSTSPFVEFPTSFHLFVPHTSFRKHTLA